ncbi:unnamed protein product [Microthlaspi erraticum]|uniref:Uncharacterized protein n=1 Tax=Microthlaspi erraticum TaxID=1685480 RepID=A0A6D2I890_9BRAS|nr:unnamed protein product [Microthlaspi erraticum]
MESDEWGITGGRKPEGQEYQHNGPVPTLRRGGNDVTPPTPLQLCSSNLEKNTLQKPNRTYEYRRYTGRNGIVAKHYWLTAHMNRRRAHLPLGSMEDLDRQKFTHL